METTIVAPAAPAATPTAPTEPGSSVKQPVGTETKSPAPAAPAEGKAPEIKKEANPDDPERPFVVKADGKEYHLTKEEAIQLASKGIGADRKFGEAAKMRQQFEDFVHVLKTDPMSILQNPNLGLDFKRLAQDYLAKEIEKEMMSPEQRELLETKEKIKQMEDEKKKGEEKANQDRMQQLVQHYSTEYEKDIQTALQTSGLPKTRGTVKRLAYYMQKGLERGVNLKAGDVIDLVRSDYIQEHNELYGSADGETLLKLFADPVLKKLNEANLKKVKGGDAMSPTLAKKPGTPDILSVPTKKMDKDEWRAELDRHVNQL